MFLLEKLDHFSDFLLSPESVKLARQQLSTTVRFCTRFMMHNSDGFLRHLNHDVDDLFNDDALLNSLLRCVLHSSRPGQHRSFRHSPLWNHLDVLASGTSVSSIILSESSSASCTSPARPCRRPSPSVPRQSSPPASRSRQPAPLPCLSDGLVFCAVWCMRH